VITEHCEITSLALTILDTGTRSSLDTGTCTDVPTQLLTQTLNTSLLENY